MLIAREAYSGREVSISDASKEVLLDTLGYVDDAPIEPMYVDKTDGRTMQVGWVIGEEDNEEQTVEWWTIYTIERFEQEVV